MLVPFFIPVENKTGLQHCVPRSVPAYRVQYTLPLASSVPLIQGSAFHGSRVLRILSDQGTEFVKSLRSMQDSVEYIWLHHQHINPRVTVLQRDL